MIELLISSSLEKNKVKRLYDLKVITVLSCLETPYECLKVRFEALNGLVWAQKMGDERNWSIGLYIASRTDAEASSY